MRAFKYKIIFFAGIACLLLAFENKMAAQGVSVRANYKFDIANATEPPKFGEIPEVKVPEKARKHGVEGLVKLSLTLGEDGAVRDIDVLRNLPFGVTEAVVKSLRQLRFQPAKRGDQPIPAKVFFDYAISTVYDENDKNIGKPQIIEKPEAVYPESRRTENLAGKVQVLAIFYSDGALQVVGYKTSLPQEFAQAAVEAAKKIKFAPAAHRKSKKAVSQKFVIEYDFKP